MTNDAAEAAVCARTGQLLHSPRLATIGDCRSAVLPAADTREDTARARAAPLEAGESSNRDDLGGGSPMRPTVSPHEGANAAQTREHLIDVFRLQTGLNKHAALIEIQTP